MGKLGKRPAAEAGVDKSPAESLVAKAASRATNVHHGSPGGIQSKCADIVEGLGSVSCSVEHEACATGSGSLTALASMLKEPEKSKAALEPHTLSQTRLCHTTCGCASSRRLVAHIVVKRFTHATNVGPLCECTTMWALQAEGKRKVKDEPRSDKEISGKKKKPVSASEPPPHAPTPPSGKKGQKRDGMECNQIGAKWAFAPHAAFYTVLMHS